MLPLIFVLFCVCSTLADLSHINAYVMFNVCDKKPIPIYNQNINDLKNCIFIQLFNTTVKVLEEGDVTHFPNLTDISISGAQLENLQPKCFAALPKLNSLSLIANDLVIIPREVFDNLTISYLSLQKNRIQIIRKNAFNNMPSLHELDLSHNILAYIDGDWFSNCGIKVIDLSSNVLSEIPIGAFRNLKTLQFINLNKNRIKFLNENSFKGLTNLYWLTLETNKMKEIYNGTFRDQKNMRFLQLGSNKLKCLSDDTLNSIVDGSYVVLRKNEFDNKCISKLVEFRLKHPLIYVYH